MTIQDALTFGAQFGVPLLMLLGIAFFFTRYVWPYMTAQNTAAQAQRDSERTKFFETLDSIRAQFQKQLDDERLASFTTLNSQRDGFLNALNTHANELDRIASAVRELTVTIRDVRVEK
jgi:hypothetical protein